MREAAKVLLAELLREPGDTLLLLNGFVIESHLPGFFRALKGAGKRVAGWQIDEPYYVDKNRGFAKELALLLSVDSSTVPLYREMGVRTELLPLACDPALHKPYASAPPYACDVCFVGAPFAGSRRTVLIDSIAPCLARHDARIVGATELDSWKKSLARAALLERAIRDEPVSTGDAARYFSGARVNLNLHKDSYGHAWDRNAARIEARSPNERTFAIAGCGGFQLIDDTRPDLASFFAPGRELATFRDAADLEAKIEYYLAHEDERRAMAAAAQARAYREHTYRHRLEAVLALL
jgi:spore maturation protein CgeB